MDTEDRKSKAFKQTIEKIRCDLVTDDETDELILRQFLVNRAEYTASGQLPTSGVSFNSQTAHSTGSLNN